MRPLFRVWGVHSSKSHGEEDIPIPLGSHDELKRLERRKKREGTDTQKRDFNVSWIRMMDKNEWWRREKEGDGEERRSFILPISKTTLAAYNIFFRTGIA